MRNLSRKKAFTLIEILVVIGIIALLAAILFPALSSARERARASTCMSNEHQIALAILQYTRDNGRRYPINPVCADPSDPAKNLCDGWAINIGLTKGNDSAIFQCPSEGNDDTAGFSDYWFNSGLMWSINHATPSLSEVHVRYPANTILIGDGSAGSSGSNLGAANDATTDPAIVAWSSTDDYATRHSGGANYAFADGHVKWLNPGSITTTDAAAGDNFAFRVTAP